MTVDGRQALRAAVAAAALLAGGGCAKDPTSVFVFMDADASVPPLLILRTTVTRAGDPSMQVSSERSSSVESDAADRPGPFPFPFGLKLTVDPSFAGDVVVSVEGLDWDTHAVLAGGSADAVVTAQQMTEASLTLEPVRGGVPDGGTD
ncbi:MAG TPA: hypothetical protein VIF57_09865 [Polyangia bacterium]|jgi:hypothetical protein